MSRRDFEPLDERSVAVDVPNAGQQSDESSLPQTSTAPAQGRTDLLKSALPWVLVGALAFSTLLLAMLRATGPQQARESADAKAEDPASDVSLSKSSLFAKYDLHFVPLPAERTLLQTISFGSCARQDYPQPFWDTLAEDLSPQIFIMAGDNVYGDLNMTGGKSVYSPQGGCPREDCIILKDAYRMLAGKPSFRGLVPKLPILPVWDDHDYGFNDGGASFKYRQESQEIFADFWQDPSRLAHPGVYWSRIFGSQSRIQIILLDCRFFKDAWTRRSASSSVPGPYAANPSSNATILGPVQWKWLAEELAKPAELRLVVSSIQVLPVGLSWESWGLFPKEQDRLITALGTASGAKVILSGDRHIGGLYSFNGIHELTSSSLTHTSTSNFREDSPRRIGNLIRENNIGVIRVNWNQRTYNLRLVRADTKLAGQDLLVSSVYSF